MDGEQSARVFEIFQAALEKAEGERRAFLDEACGDDGRLRAEVETLLADERVGLALFELMREADTSTETNETPAEVAAHFPKIPGYESLDVLGQGGMGKVSVLAGH